MASKRYTTAEYISWDKATATVRHLYNDGDYRMSLLMGCGIFFGLRYSDLSTLTWMQIMADEFSLYEQKTGKRRTIKVNASFKHHILDCHKALNIEDDSQPCFLTRLGTIPSIQFVNQQMKVINVKYRLHLKNISTHSLRKTWARKIWENENALGRGEQSLVVLSEIMNHSSVAITRRYLGIRQQEIGQIYESLQF